MYTRHNIKNIIVFLFVCFYSIGCKVSNQGNTTNQVKSSSDNSLIAVSDQSNIDVNNPSLINVLANDSGVLQNKIQLRVSSQPTYGSISINTDLTITYIAKSNFPGYDTFQYTITDEGGNSSTASVQISGTCLSNCGKEYTLSWNEPVTDGITIKGFYVYMGSNSRQYTDKTWASSTSLNVGRLSSGPHFFAVTAVSNDGIESDYSEEVTITIP